MKYLLMLDYDGTLVPIKKHPKFARLSRTRRAFLRGLSRQPGVKLAIISGRKLANLKKVAGIRNIVYIGNHGFEIEAGRIKWIHPAAKKFALLRNSIIAVLGRLHFRGIWIEDKGLTISLHYRLLADQTIPSFQKGFWQAIKPWRKKIKITAGKKVLELRPPVDWDKGKAVSWLLKRLNLKKHIPIYIGDDRTDEDAFWEIKGLGLAIRVGRINNSLAGYFLKDVKAVYAFLGEINKRRPIKSLQNDWLCDGKR